MRLILKKCFHFHEYESNVLWQVSSQGHKRPPLCYASYHNYDHHQAVVCRKFYMAILSTVYCNDIVTSFSLRVRESKITLYFYWISLANYSVIYRSKSFYYKNYFTTAALTSKPTHSLTHNDGRERNHQNKKP